MNERTLDQQCAYITALLNSEPNDSISEFSELDSWYKRKARRLEALLPQLLKERREMRAEIERLREALKGGEA